MTFRKKAIIVLITGICAAMLGGCRQYTTKSGHALDKNKVLQAVRLECPTEQIELISEDISNTLPEEVTYHFRSTKRDLEFDAVSSVRNLSFFKNGDTPIYYKNIEVGYADAVAMLYKDEYFYAMLNEVGSTSIFFHHPSEFEQIAQNVVMVSDIYAPEKQFNTEEWMSEHPLHHSIAIMWVPASDNDIQNDKVKIANIEINGCITYDEVIEALKEAYDHNVANGKIPR